MKSLSEFILLVVVLALLGTPAVVVLAGVAIAICVVVALAVVAVIAAMTPYFLVARISSATHQGELSPALCVAQLGSKVRHSKRIRVPVSPRQSKGVDLNEKAARHTGDRHPSRRARSEPGGAPGTAAG
jgi:hypothetical protein